MSDYAITSDAAPAPAAKRHCTDQMKVHLSSSAVNYELSVLCRF